MKKIFFLIIVLFSLFIDQNFAQLNWIQLSSGTFENLKDVYFIDVNTGWAVGNAGKALKTTNYGQVWTNCNFPTSSNNNCVFFINANTGFIGNSNGNVYKSTNGGSTWTPYPTGVSSEVTTIFFTSELIGFLGNVSGNIRNTIDGGLTWSLLSQTPGRVNKISFIDSFRGWVVDNNGYIFRTTNSGTSFNYSRPTTNPINGIQFISSTIGYACSDSGKVLKSTNGGANWIVLNTGHVSIKLNKIATLHPEIAMAVGGNGYILQTINGGNNWSVQIPTTYNLSSIYFVPGTIYGYCVGDVGTMYRSFTIPGGGGCVGNSTTQIGFPFYSSYMDSRTDILFVRNELALATGMNAGYIYSIGFYFTSYADQPLNGFKIKMQNTSLTSLAQFTSTGWMIVYDGTYSVTGTGLKIINLQVPFYWSGNNLLVEICFNNNVSTYNSTIYSTSNAGMTFHNHSNLPTGDGCIDITTGAAQTYRPNVCFYTSIISGLGNSKNIVPENYKLYQNHPNPFNPVTKIQYDIPKKSIVTLSIYDVLGKHIETLVNESREAGSYLIDYDASLLPSGIYYYKLAAGDFVQTKKMILVK